MPHKNRRIGKPAGRLRRKATGPVIWQPAALSQPYRTWASPQGAVDFQSTKRRALYQPFGRCGALFALCGHGYILGVIHKRRIFMKKRFVSLLVVVCMLLTLFPVSAFADNAKSGEFHTDGIKTQDGNFVYSVNEDDTATLVQYIGSEDALEANNYEVIPMRVHPQWR